MHIRITSDEMRRSMNKKSYQHHEREQLSDLNRQIKFSTEIVFFGQVGQKNST